MWWQKKIIHVNNNLIINDLLFKHDSEKRWKIQIFTFAFEKTLYTLTMPP